MLFWIILGMGAAVLIAATIGQNGAPARRSAAPSPPEEEGPLDLVARDAPEALARFGTPETVEYLRETGRADELRGLGYRD